MANPNIGAFTSITGNTAVQAVTTSPTAILTNSSGSNQLYKIYSLSVSNYTTNNTSVLVDFYRSSTSYKLAGNISVPANSSLVLITKDNGIYLVEGDSIRVSASANTSLDAVCSYEVVT